MRIEEALGRYLVQLAADGRSPHTIGQARRHVRLLAAWVEATGRADDVAALTAEDVAGFLASDTVRLRADGQRRRPTSSNALRSSLRTFFHYCAASGYAPSNVARLVRRARVGPSAPNALREDEREKLVAAMAGAQTDAERRDQALFGVLAATGLRIGSALGLDVEDVDLERGELRVRTLKNGGEDVVYLPKETIALLDGYIGDRAAGPLFPGVNGRRLGVRQFHRRLSAWAERAALGRRIHPHTVRHGFAMRLYAQTGDLGLVGRALLHRNLCSTVTYARPTADRVRAAVETCAGR